MRLWTREQALEIDRRTTETTSLEDLVEAAGAGLAREIARRVPSRAVTVIAGPGLNGADARVAARELTEKFGFRARVFEKPVAGILEEARNSTVIDGLFGTGLSRPLEPAWAQLFAELNARKADVLAVDLPSGVHPDTGCLLGGAPVARATLTLGAPKPGLFLREGPAHRGRLIVVPMPFEKTLTRAIANSVFLFGKQGARALLPARTDTGHKYSHGELMCVAGSVRYRGAAVLTAKAALRMGVGFVHLASPDDVFPEWFELPETLFHKISVVEKMPERWRGLAWAVGPGFEGDASGLLRWLEKNGIAKAVLDAAALRALARAPRALPAGWVLTPHAGEAAELLGISAAAVEEDRLAAAGELARKFSCIAVLKGFHTVVAAQGKCWIVNSGNSALAKAGTGDVLTGMLGACLAQLEDPLRAALLATWIHGGLADDWVRTGRDHASLIPSDLLERLPLFLKQLRSGSSSSKRKG